MEGTLNQPYIFAATVYGGMLTGGVYVIFQLLIRCFRSKKVVVILCDILFILGMLALNGVILYLATGMKLRPYMFGGMLIGFVLFTWAIFPLGKYMKRLLQQKKRVDKERKKGCNKISRIERG